MSPGAGRRPSAEPGAPDVDPVAAQAVEAYFTLFNQMHRYYSEVCGRFDLTPQLGAVLRGLADPSPMRELARTLHIDASNLTGLVDRLERRELLERRADPEDRRVRQLVLTADGARLRQELNQHLFAAPPVLAGLDGDQRVQLRDLLHQAAGARTATVGMERVRAGPTQG